MLYYLSHLRSLRIILITMSNKLDKAYKTIGEVANLLNLKNISSGKLNTYVLRYWEKEFKQIKPKIINKRRYYNNKQIEIIKLIKYLIKDKGVSINGVKNILKSGVNSLDVNDLHSLKADYQINKIKLKANKILEQLKKIKKDG